MGLREILEEQRRKREAEAAKNSAPIVPAIPVAPPVVAAVAVPTIAAPTMQNTAKNPAVSGLARFKKPSPTVVEQSNANQSTKTPSAPTPVVAEKPKESEPRPAILPASEAPAKPITIQPIASPIIAIIPKPNGQDKPPQKDGGPDNIPEGVKELRKNLNYLSANIEQKELVGQVVRTILVQLKKNPQFSTHLVAADFNLITRGFRRTAVVAARKKMEAREKRETKKKVSNEFEDAMGGIEFNLDE